MSGVSAGTAGTLAELAQYARTISTAGLPATASRRDETEFRGFGAKFAPTLLRSAYLLLGDRDAAEDAVQSTLLRTLRRWGKAKATPEAYSRRVLLNVCRDHWHHQRRHPFPALDDRRTAPEVGVSPIEGVEQRLAAYTFRIDLAG